MIPPKQQSFPYYIAGVNFGTHKIWETLSNGWMRSVIRNTDAGCIIRNVPWPLEQERRRYLKSSHMENNWKLRWWKEIVYKATKPIVLMDTDCLVLDDIDLAWAEQPQDIILTDRGDKWVNAGVIFVRPGEVARRFFDDWLHADDFLLTQPRLHRKNINTKGHHIVGQNQLSLWSIYPKFQDQIGWVPCLVYNSCEDQYWTSRGSKVIHVKSALRTELQRALQGRNARRYPDLVQRILPYYQED